MVASSASCAPEAVDLVLIAGLHDAGFGLAIDLDGPHQYRSRPRTKFQVSSVARSSTGTVTV